MVGWHKHAVQVTRLFVGLDCSLLSLCEVNAVGWF